MTYALLWCVCWKEPEAVQSAGFSSHLCSHQEAQSPPGFEIPFPMASWGVASRVWELRSFT